MHIVLSIIAVLGVGSIVAGLISWRIAISNHRQAWINALRDDLSTYLKELETMHYVTFSLLSAKADDGTLEKTKQDARLAILFTYWRIVLRLNRTEQMHIDLRQKLDDLMSVKARVPDLTKLNEAVDLARQLLKREWDVTKYGVFTRPVLWAKSRFGSN
jgi:hypothetical protein